MRNGRPERTFLRALGVGVDPLVIIRRIGEHVDLLLSDLYGTRRAEFGTDEGGEVFECDGARGGVFCLHGIPVR